jgi:hypothetical protein
LRGGCGCRNEGQGKQGKVIAGACSRHGGLLNVH